MLVQHRLDAHRVVRDSLPWFQPPREPELDNVRAERPEVADHVNAAGADVCCAVVHVLEWINRLASSVPDVLGPDVAVPVSVFVPTRRVGVPAWARMDCELLGCLNDIPATPDAMMNAAHGRRVPAP